MALTDQAFNWYISFKDNASAALEKAHKVYTSTSDALSDVINHMSDVMDNEESTAGKVTSIMKSMVDSVSDSAGAIRSTWRSLMALPPIEPPFEPPSHEDVEGALQDISNQLAVNSMDLSGIVDLASLYNGADNITSEFWDDFWHKSTDGMDTFWGNIGNAKPSQVREMVDSLKEAVGDSGLTDMFWENLSKFTELPTDFVKNLRGALESDTEIARGFWGGIGKGVHRVEGDISDSMTLAMSHPRIFSRFGSGLKRIVTSTFGQALAAFSVYRILDQVLGPVWRELSDLIGIIIFPLQEMVSVILDELRPALLKLQAPMILLVNKYMPDLREWAFKIREVVAELAKGFEGELLPVIQDWINIIWEGVQALKVWGVGILAIAKIIGGYWVAMLILSTVIMVSGWINSIAQAVIWTVKFTFSILKAAWSVVVFSVKIFTEYIPAMLIAARKTYWWIASLLRGEAVILKSFIPAMWKQLFAMKANTAVVVTQAGALRTELIPAMKAAWAWMGRFTMAIWRGIVTVVTVWIPAIWGAAVTLITVYIPALWASAMTMLKTWIPIIWAGAVSLVAGLVPAMISAVVGLYGMVPAFLAAATAAWAFTAALLANPITWIVVAVIAAVAALIAIMWYFWDSSMSILENITQKFWVLLGPIGWIIKAGSMLYEAWEPFRDMIDTIWSALKDLWSWIKSFFSGEEIMIGADIDPKALADKVAAAGDAAEEETQGWGDWLKGMVGIPDIETDQAAFMEGLGLESAGGDGASLEDFMAGLGTDTEPGSMQDFTAGLNVTSPTRDSERVQWTTDAAGNITRETGVTPNGIPPVVPDSTGVSEPYTEAALNVNLDEDYSGMSDPVVTAVDRQTQALLAAMASRPGEDHDLSFGDLDDMASFGSNS